MTDLTNQQLLDTIRQEFATKEDIAKLDQKLIRLDRKLDSHREASTQHHLRILEEIGNLNKKFIKVTESQEGLGRRFNKLRIVTE